MTGSRSKFGSYLKGIAVGFYKDNTIISDGCVLGYTSTIEQQRICNKITHLVLDDNGFFKADTKNWLTGSAVFGSNAPNTNTSRSRINYDVGKLEKALGINSMEVIYKKMDGYQHYEEVIDNLIKRYSSRSILDDLIFPVKHRDIICMPVNLDSAEKAACIKLFSSYNKEIVKRAEKSITLEMISYIKYLEKNKDSLSDEDKEIYSSIIETL